MESGAVMNEKQVYEFNLEHYKIRHFLLINRIAHSQTLSPPLIPPELMEEMMRMGADFCDFDPMDLPFYEFENFITQLIAALGIAMRNPDDIEDGNLSNG
jgi:hypothetical protein